MISISASTYRYTCVPNYTYAHIHATHAHTKVKRNQNCRAASVDNKEVRLRQASRFSKHYVRVLGYTRSGSQTLNSDTGRDQTVAVSSGVELCEPSYPSP